jgi:hypothetical protein
MSERVEEVERLRAENARLEKRVAELQAVRLAYLWRREEVIDLMRRRLDMGEARAEISRRRARREHLTGSRDDG